MNSSRAFAVIIFVASVITCKSEDRGASERNDAGSAAATPRFEGPSCPASAFIPDNPTTEACDACGRAKCSLACAESACGDFYRCTCACAAQDTPCLGGCFNDKRTQECDVCITSLLLCRYNECASECSPTPPDGGSSTSDGGPTGPCAKLDPCCYRLPDPNACYARTRANDAPGCQKILDDSKGSGLCE